MSGLRSTHGKKRKSGHRPRLEVRRLRVDEGKAQCPLFRLRANANGETILLFRPLERLHFYDFLDAQEFGPRIFFTRLFCER
jgi:hypothetical protein